MVWSGREDDEPERVRRAPAPERPPGAFVCSSCCATAPTRAPWCPRCGAWGSYVLAVTPPSIGLADTVVKTASELAAGSSKWIDLPKDVNTVFGPLPVGSWSMALWGPPGSFKSTSALVLSNALCDAVGPVIYVSLEEGLGATVGERLRRLEIRRDDLLVVCMPDLVQVVELARERDAKVVVIDSLGYLPHVDAEDLARLSREAGVSYVAILHATKSGQARGPLSILHHVDVVIALEGGKFTSTKNRFGSLKEGQLSWAT